MAAAGFAAPSGAAGAAPQYAFAGYAGIAVWGRVDPPADQIRALGRNERVEALGPAGGGWMRVRLPEGYEGFVRADALRPFAVGGQGATRVPQPESEAGQISFASAPGGAFPGSHLVAIGLNVAAWLTLIGGQLAGLWAAASYECSSYISDCSDTSGERIVLYATFGLTSLFSALLTFWLAYIIGFLDRIERKVRALA